MSSSPAFTAIITSYNYRQFIAEAIDSALAQTQPPVRIVVVDDGSSDGSPAYVRERYAGQPAVQVVEQANQGQLRAFAAGVAHAEDGDVVAFLDSDDLWEPQYLEAVGDVLRKRPETDYVYTNMRFLGERHGTYHHRARSGSDGTSILVGCYARSWRTSPTSGVCIRRSLVQRIISIPDELAAGWRTRADDCLTYGADVLGGRKFYLSPALAIYRVHGSNSYLGREDDEATAAAHRRKVETLVAHYCEIAGIDPAQRGSQCRGALQEFRTKPDPVRSDLKRYLRLVDQAEMSGVAKMSMCIRMWLHYLRGRLYAREPADASPALRNSATAGGSR